MTGNPTTAGFAIFPVRRLVWRVVVASIAVLVLTALLGFPPDDVQAEHNAPLRSVEETIALRAQCDDEPRLLYTWKGNEYWGRPTLSFERADDSITLTRSGDFPKRHAFIDWRPYHQGTYWQWDSEWQGWVDAPTTRVYLEPTNVDPIHLRIPDIDRGPWMHHLVGICWPTSFLGVWPFHNWQPFDWVPSYTITDLEPCTAYKVRYEATDHGSGVVLPFGNYSTAPGYSRKSFYTVVTTGCEGNPEAKREIASVSARGITHIEEGVYTSADVEVTWTLSPDVLKFDEYETFIDWDSSYEPVFTGYEIEINSYDDRFEVEDVIIEETGTGKHVIKDLPLFELYGIRIRALTPDGPTSWSPWTTTFTGGSEGPISSTIGSRQWLEDQLEARKSAIGDTPVSDGSSKESTGGSDDAEEEEPTKRESDENLQAPPTLLPEDPVNISPIPG